MLGCKKIDLLLVIVSRTWYVLIWHVIAKIESRHVVTCYHAYDGVKSVVSYSFMYLEKDYFTNKKCKWMEMKED